MARAGLVCRKPPLYWATEFLPSKPCLAELRTILATRWCGPLQLGNGYRQNGSNARVSYAAHKDSRLCRVNLLFSLFFIFVMFLFDQYFEGHLRCGYDRTVLT